LLAEVVNKVVNGVVHKVVNRVFHEVFDYRTCTNSVVAWSSTVGREH